MEKDKQSNQPTGAGVAEAGGPVEKKKVKVKEVNVEELQDIQDAMKEEEAADGAPPQETQTVQEEDFCPACGTFSNGGAVQVKIPVELGVQTIVLNLPTVVCLRCGNNYTPISFVNKMVNPEPEPQVVLAKPNVKV
jgi:hypothetical protein